MRTLSPVVTLWMCCALMGFVQGALSRFATKEHNTPTYRLHRYLTKRYNSHVRPVLNPSDIMSVKYKGYVYQIMGVNQRANTISLTASFELFWNDPLLTWEPEHFGGLQDIFLHSKTIWTPELSPYYSIKSNRMIGKFTNLRVNSSGGVRYYAPFAVENLCHIDVKYFPYDSQTCTLYFGPWAYRDTELDLVPIEDTADTKDFFDNQEWTLKGTKMYKFNFSYSHLEQPVSYNAMALEIHIKRQSFYYIFNLVLPTAFIAIVSVIGFHMPGTSSSMRDAKFRLGIMTILSMTMLLLSIVDDMPKFSNSSDPSRRLSSSAVPLIGIYYFSLLFIIALGTVTSSMFVALERHVRHKEVPKWLEWLAWDPWSPYKNYQLSQDMIIVNGMVRRKENLKVCPGDEEFFHRRESLQRRFSSGPTNPEHAALIAAMQEMFKEIILTLLNIEKSVVGMRHELYAFMPKNSITNQWAKVINRLTMISMAGYLIAIFIVILLFFNPGWY